MTGSEFGNAVRRWRDRVRPEAAGLNAGGHRRAAGLRREELALLAGISVDYVTRLEQGRASNPSSQVVEALGRALRVSAAEREQLFHAAGLVPPGQGTVPAFIAPSVRRMLDRLEATPVAVFDAATNLLLANPMYTALMGEQLGKERNAAWRNFLGSGNRVRHTPESLHQLRSAQVADLRASEQRYPADLQLRNLIGELKAKSPLFTSLWEAAAIVPHSSAAKVIDHPQIGSITLDCDILAVVGSDLRMMIYTAAPGSPDAQNLALLAVLGSQSLID
ncbi:helix-turn-helix transcriptional regulator [Psychromicrobium lacuslunae]|uniref:XRE family transcriptional regulator n=1 Tax=Psychromicrobium lacuslunae TaxID=1618207 RepID=A0A0D4BWJ0_9MICC|nr:helix-turn-helix transcriptional regulator [Psychromicrobium lacuslunae]AJT40674.1 XRE family transcriptional regulator [Psychromicrobium lacuslunae]